MLFTKMHGLGNDFIIIEDLDNIYNEYSKMSRIMCDRHFGIGADGLLIVKSSNTAHCKMLIYNSDGSEPEMCGNGIRCFAKYLFDNKIVNSEVIDIETQDGIKKIKLEIDKGLVVKVRVDMGKPDFAPGSIPVLLQDKDRIINEPVKVDVKEYRITSMLMGVPHTILFVNDINLVDIKGIGREIEESLYFPRKTNVNFVKVVNRKEISVRTWERGAGSTLACGTGTCASVIAGVLNDVTDRKVTAHLFGGDLYIEWDTDDTVYMTGSAKTVFTGEYTEI